MADAVVAVRRPARPHRRGARCRARGVLRARSTSPRTDGPLLVVHDHGSRPHAHFAGRRRRALATTGARRRGDVVDGQAGLPALRPHAARRPPGARLATAPGSPPCCGGAGGNAPRNRPRDSRRRHGAASFRPAGDSSPRWPPTMPLRSAPARARSSATGRASPRRETMRSSACSRCCTGSARPIAVPMRCGFSPRALDALLRRTTPISAHYLRLAIDGHFGEHLTDLVDALGSGNGVGTGQRGPRARHRRHLGRGRAGRRGRGGCTSLREQLPARRRRKWHDDPASHRRQLVQGLGRADGDLVEAARARRPRRRVGRDGHADQPREPGRRRPRRRPRRHQAVRPGRRGRRHRCRVRRRAGAGRGTARRAASRATAAAWPSSRRRACRWRSRGTRR